MANPYQSLHETAFWRPAVAEKGPLGLSGLWASKFRIGPQDKIITAGSCFAQHISRALRARGYNWLNAEPAPPFLPKDAAQQFNYGIFSFRTGNIYTPAMLLQWLRLAFGTGDVPDEIWQQDGRFFDPLRPVIEPGGFATEAELRAARQATQAAIAQGVKTANLLVFTLGLTEGWENAKTGLHYALCPGTVPGAAFDPDLHRFNNADFASLARIMGQALRLLRAQNPRLRVLLTVSPVPLTATATPQHVLTATSHSKSVLRALAGELALKYRYVDYFPSYEIITHPVFRGMFFAPNMRSVEQAGVDTVMGHFFADQARVFGVSAPSPKAKQAPETAADGEDDLRCEEEMLGAFAK